MPFKAKFKDKNASAGIGRLVYFIKKHRKPNSIVMVGGDILQGTIFSTVFKGEAALKIFNNIVDYMVAGNHEFDYGQENLIRLTKLAKFKIFSSNVFKSSGTPFFKQNLFIHKIGGINIGIFGLTTCETPVSTHPRNVSGLKFINETDAARNSIVKLKSMGAKIIIALNHIGFKNDIKLAKAVKGIDLIIGGHSHTKLKKGYKIGKTLIAQAYEYGLYLGIINLVVDKENGKLLSKRAKLIKITDAVPFDREAISKLSYYRQKLKGSLNRIVGTSLITLDGSRETVRCVESNLGNLIADVIKKSASAEIGFINGGGIRASIQKGKISVRDILRVLPFNNTIYSMRLSGADIIKILSKSAGKAKGDGGFLQVSSGIKIVIKNNSLLSLTFLGKQIIKNRYYTVAVSDFMASGGDGYRKFKKAKNIVDTGISLSDALINYISRIKKVRIARQGRIERF